MGIFDIFKSKKSQPENMKKRGNGLTLAGAPERVLTAEEFWASDIPTQAISRIISELIKFEPQHVKVSEWGELFNVSSGIQKILDVPNSWDTGSDLLEQLYWDYFYRGNAYVVPTYELVDGHKVYTGMYRVQPIISEHFIDDNSGLDCYYLEFQSGYSICLPAEDVIHLKRDLGQNPYFGGDRTGRPHTRSLQKIATIDQKLISGVSKSIESSSMVRGILRYNAHLRPEGLDEAVEDFYARLRHNDSAILPLGLDVDYKPLSQDTHVVDAETLRFVDERFLRAFGVSRAILSGDFTSEQQKSFRSTAVQPVLEKLEKELTKKIFTQNERTRGNRIKFFIGEISYVDHTTVEALTMGITAGILTVNEIRQALGYRPLKEWSTDENGQPRAVMSKNFGDSSSVATQIDKEIGIYQEKSEEEPKKEEDTDITTQEKDEKDYMK